MENLRGAAFMVFAMASFAVEDAIIKQLTLRIPVGEVLAITCGGALLIFLVWSVIRAIPIWQPEYLDRKVILRSTSDVVGSLLFVTSLSLIPLTTASAVIQATPLVVGLGAALVLGQSMGWRRWLAILVGFAGVLIIIRPGTDGFSPATLIAVAGMLGLAIRDLITRSLTVSLNGVQLATHTFAMIVPAGLTFMWLSGETLVLPNLIESWLFLASILIGIVAYLAIVEATRHGHAGIISSFRYSRMIFAIIVAYIAFRELPDAPTILGASIVIASGLFTLARETRLRRASITPNPTL